MSQLEAITPSGNILNTRSQSCAYNKWSASAMSRPSRSERLASSKGRPRRRAAKTHFFKYQLAANPNRAEENDLKRALQESMEEHKSVSINGTSKQNGTKKSCNNSKRAAMNSSTNSSDVSKLSNNSSSSTSAESYGSPVPVSLKRTRSSAPIATSVTPPPATKRAKIVQKNDHHHHHQQQSNNKNIQSKSKCDSDSSVLSVSPTTLPQVNSKAIIRTYSRSQASSNGPQQQQQQSKPKQTCDPGPRSSTPLLKLPPTTTTTTSSDKRSNGIESTSATGKSQSYVSRSTQTSVSEVKNFLGKNQSIKQSGQGQLKSCLTNPVKSTPPQSSKSQITTTPPQQQQPPPPPPPPPVQYLKFKRESKNYAYVKMTALRVSTSKSPMSRDQNLANVSIMKKRVPQGSWSLLGVPEEKLIYLRDDEPPRRLICYPAIKHVEGDVIQVRDSVLLRSGAKKTDLPYIAKVCSFWEDAETGAIMMSLFWYYRPEHIEDGRKSHHLQDEIFASRHRDVDSVECIEDKCYVLTFNEYCRFKKRCKMEQVNTTWSLADVTIPVSNESYPRRNRIPDVDVNPELVFCCRQIYDSRMRRLIKNPLINPKYGHI